MKWKGNLNPPVVYDTSKMFSAYNWLGKRKAVIIADNKAKAREVLRGHEHLWVLVRYRYKPSDFQGSGRGA